MSLKVHLELSISVILFSACSYVLVRIFSTGQCCHIDAWGNQIRTFCRSAAIRGSHPGISWRYQPSERNPRVSTWLSHHCLDRHRCRAFSKETLAQLHIESIFPLFFCYREYNIHQLKPFSSRSKHSGLSNDRSFMRVPSTAEVSPQFQQAEKKGGVSRSEEERESAERTSKFEQCLFQQPPPHFWGLESSERTNSSASAR